MSDIIGIGACVLDTLISVSTFPQEDKKVPAVSTLQAGGGPSATAIVAAARLGEKAAFIGNLTDDTIGQFLKQDFEGYSVNTDGIRMIAGKRPFASYVLLAEDNGSRTCVYDRGDLPGTTLDAQHVEMLKQAKLLEVDGNDLAAAVEAAKIVRANGGKVLYDAGGLYEGVDALLQETDILIPSEEFALRYTGEETVEAAAEKLFEQFNIEVIVITQGKHGGFLFDGKTRQYYPTYPAKVVDSNGAGDVFHGAFSAAVVKGYDYLKCCHFASAVAGLKCENVGARRSVPTFETVKEYMRRNGYEL